MGPILALFGFTIRQTLVTRKVWLTILILAAPCALLLLIRAFEPSTRQAQTLWEMYHVPAHFFLMSALVPLVCVVHGAALIGADIEARTITYLTTRRMRRATVLIVKYVATAVVLALLCDVAMVGLHFCALGGRDLTSVIAHSEYSGWDPTGDLGCYLLVLPLAVVGFLAIFSLIGLVYSRPLALSVVYLIIVELILSNLPLKARMYTLSHQLRVTLAGAIPRLTRLYELPADLREEMYLPGETALVEVLGIVVVALALAALMVTVRELMPAKMSRE